MLITTAPRRRQFRDQARRLTPRYGVSRQYFPLILVAGAVLGVLIRLLVASLLPPEPPVIADSAETDRLLEVMAFVPPTPTPDPRVVGEQRLREAALEPFQGVMGRFGVAVVDLGSGLAVYENEREQFQAASLFKLGVMYSVFKLREQGELSFREETVVTSADAAQDLPPLPLPVGTTITLGTALERMITLSDNVGAYILLRRIGAAQVNDDLVDLDLIQTFIRSGDLSTTPLDMARLLSLIAEGQAVDASTSGEMVHLLARSRVRDRIPALMPQGTVVANKTGNWDSAAHDVGIVYTPRGTIVMVFLSEGIVDNSIVHSAMARAARNVYEVVNDPAFPTTPRLPLPRQDYATYAAPAKVPYAPAAPAIAAPGRAAPARPPAAAPAPAIRAQEQGSAAIPAAAPKPVATVTPTQAPAKPTSAPPAPTSAPAVRPATPTSAPNANRSAPALAPTPTADTERRRR